MCGFAPTSRPTDLRFDVPPVIAVGKRVEVPEPEHSSEGRHRRACSNTRPPPRGESYRWVKYGADKPSGSFAAAHVTRVDLPARTSTTYVRATACSMRNS